MVKGRKSRVKGGFCAHIKLLCKIKFIMDCPHGVFGVFSVYKNAYPYFACGYHLNVYSGVVKRLKHCCGNARVGGHSGADNGYFGNVVVMLNAFCADKAVVFVDGLKGEVKIVFRYGKADVLITVAPD